MLSDGGFEVVGEVVDAASAVQAVARLRPDVVLLDVYLPDGNGFDVAEELATRASASRIVMVSSRDRRSFAHRLAATSARGFIDKAELSGDALASFL